LADDDRKSRESEGRAAFRELLAHFPPPGSAAFDAIVGIASTKLLISRLLNQNPMFSVYQTLVAVLSSHLAHHRNVRALWISVIENAKSVTMHVKDVVGLVGQLAPFLKVASAAPLANLLLVELSSSGSSEQWAAIANPIAGIRDRDETCPLVLDWFTF
jgi:hypothetical protein